MSIQQGNPSIDIKKNIVFYINKLIMLIALVAVIIVFANLSPYFLSIKNFYAVGLTISIIGIICIGQTFCIITRGFDLSVGATAAFCGIMVAYWTNGGIPYVVSLLLALGLGALIGLVNGFLIAKAKINAFITTLSFMSIYTGFVYIVSKGYSIIVNKPGFNVLGTTRVYGMPLPIIILICLYIIFYIVLRHTVFGRYVYCIGGNPDAARIAGINVEKYQILVYMISGILASFGGVILASRMGAAQTTVGTSYALDSVAAVVLGGTALTGGQGNLLGTLIGVGIIGVLQNGLVMIDMPSYYQFVATGAVLLVAVLLQTINVKKA